MDIPQGFIAPHIDPKPCNFDLQILPQLVRQQQLAKEKVENCPYQLIAGGQEDWNRVCKLYNANNSKIPGLEVYKVEVIVNPLFSEEFLPRLKLLEERGKNAEFQPDWEADSQFFDILDTPETEMRRQVNDHLQKIVKNPAGFKHSKVVAMFHGTKENYFDGIYRGNLANLAKTDSGFFGKGVYHTSSAKYAYKYTENSGKLLLNWICFSSAYPVIHHPQIRDDLHWESLNNSDPLKKRHWKYLSGRQGAISGKYNAHYALVSPEHPNDPLEINYFPFVEGKKHLYDELVTFDPCQVLPRYEITLGPRLGHCKSPSYTPLYFRKIQQIVLPQELQRDVQDNQLFNRDELIELGHLMYLKKAQNPAIKQDSMLYLKERRAIESVRNQTPFYSSLPIDFNEMFKLHRPNNLANVGERPFEPIQDSIIEKEFEHALNLLINLFGSKADPDLCYTYLFHLIDQIKDWDIFAKNLPYLLERSSHCIEDRFQLAIELACRYKKREDYPNAMGCYGKALAISESKKLHESSSEVFIKIILSNTKPLFKKPNDLEFYLKMVKSLKRFWLKQSDRTSFYCLANERIIGLEITDQLIPFKEEIIKCTQEPFHLPELTTTERYWRAFKQFTEFFTKEIKDVKVFQQNASKIFINFFNVLLEDAFLIIGNPPCDYDIRAGGAIGRGDIFPQSDLECIILVSQRDHYFQSLIKILKIQLLITAIKADFTLVVKTEEHQHSATQTISLATNNHQMFDSYRADCRKTPLPFHSKGLFNKIWEKDITLGLFKQQYATPLVQLLSDLALFYRLENTNTIAIIDYLPFTPDSHILLKESIELFYRLSLVFDKKTPLNTLPDQEIQALQKSYWLVIVPLHSIQSKLEDKQSVIDLEYIARTKGFFLKFEQQQFHRDLKKLFIRQESDVKITFPGPVFRYLNPNLKMLDNNNDLLQHYSSAHNVCRLTYKDIDFHFKQTPGYPLMEYAIHSLCSRIAGNLTPYVELVRFQIGKKSFPVLISRTIHGTTLDKSRQLKPVELDLKQWTRMLLCTILTCPADGSLSNYILDKEKKGKVYCIDNDLSFVEPAEIGLISCKVNFFSVLFSLLPLKTSLDKEVLKEFSTLDRISILKDWIEDVIEKEKEYLTLFSEEERKVLFDNNSEKSFNSSILFKEGALATLDLQFFRLQTKATTSPDLTSGDLLKELISIREESIGTYVYNKYRHAVGKPVDRHQELITSSKRVGTMTTMEYHEACLGRKISYQEIENSSYCPQKAKKELSSSMLKNFEKTAKIIERTGKMTIQANFKELENHPSRQVLVLKALALKGKPNALILNYSNCLNVKLLVPFLHSKLEHIDLSYCPLIDNETLYQIQDCCPNLKELYLIKTGITKFEVLFLKLESANLKDCKLEKLNVTAPQLQNFNMSGNHRLKGYMDKETLLLAVKQDGNVAQYAHPDLKKDKQFMLRLIKENIKAYLYSDSSIINKNSFILAAFRQNPAIIKYLILDRRANLFLLLKRTSDWELFANFTTRVTNPQDKQYYLDIISERFKYSDVDNKRKISKGLSLLKKGDSKEFIPLLLTCLQDNDSEVKSNIILALSLFWHFDYKIILLLEGFLHYSKYTFIEMQAAIKALERLCTTPHAFDIARKLEKFILEGPNDQIRAEAIQSFGCFWKIDHQVVGLLKQYSNSINTQVKEAADSALGKINRAKAEGCYLLFLKHRKEQIHLQIAYENCEQAAVLGHEEACYEFFLLCKSRKIEKKVSEAYEFCKKAADAGHPQACFEMSLKYRKDSEQIKQKKQKKQNWDKSHEYCRKAAFLGHKDACYEYFLYFRLCKGSKIDEEIEEGSGIDEVEAYEFCKKAADAGHPQACFEMFLNYREDSDQIKQNWEKSLEYCRKAADLGVKEAIQYFEIREKPPLYR